MNVTGQKGSYNCGNEPRARGGQAWVYRGTDGSGRSVAVKVCQELGEMGTWMDREREELLRLLGEHADLRAKLVEIVDWGQTPGGYRFVVMPWYPHTLRDWLMQQPLEKRLLGLAEAAEAVNALHRSEKDIRQGVVHRDIKPSNFLVSTSGEVLLSDFGSVKRAHLRTASFDTGRHTLGFAPPDQVLPRKVVPDQSWDAYALAVTIFWGITGEMPASTQEASSLLTVQGRKLVRLAQSTSLTGERLRELETLARQDVSALVDISRLRPLLDEDVEMLTERLTALLVGRVSDPAALAGEISEELVEVLADALEPDPKQRNSDIRPIKKRCELLARKVERALARQQHMRSAPPSPVGETVDPIWPGHKGSRPGPPHAASPAMPAPTLPPEPQTIGVRLAPAAPTLPPVIPPVATRTSPPASRPGKPSSSKNLLASVGLGLAGVLLVATVAAVAVWQTLWPDSPVDPGPTSIDAAQQRSAPPAAGEIQVLDGISMAWIPAGSFKMGSPETDPDAEPDEKPQRTVAVDAFWLMETEVTQGLWQAVMGRNPSKFSSCGLNCPVEQISWCDAVIFANALSKRDKLKLAYTLPAGFNASMSAETCDQLSNQVQWDRDADGYRLPTEAEWEYAARAGTMGRYGASDTGDGLVLFGWFKSNSNGTTHPAGLKEKAPNSWNLREIQGNVYEWCWDAYDKEAYARGGSPVESEYRVFRGGSWFFTPLLARLADRGWDKPSTRWHSAGLRLARGAK